MKEIQYDTIIIGAGLTGLSTGHFLKKKGKQFLILEKSDKAGGVLQTHRENGFTFEAGPNTGTLGTDEIVELTESLKDNCPLDLANEKAKKRWIWKGNKFHALPSGLIGGLKTPLFKWKDKFGILGEPFRKKGTNPYESVADMVKRRLGESYLHYAVDPFISGVYAGDPHRLITQFALPKLYRLEQDYGSFIKGSFQKHKEAAKQKVKRRPHSVISFKGGMHQLAIALRKELADQVYLNCKNIQIHQTENGFKIEFNLNGEIRSVHAKNVITTTNAQSLPGLLPFIKPEEIKPITALDYAKVVQVAVGYNNWKGMPIQAFGGLVPSIEQKQVLGILFPSSIFKNRAPEKGALLSVFIGGIRHPEMIDKTDDEIKEIVLSAIKEMLHCKDKPDLIKVFRYEHAIAQYELTSEERLKTIDKFQKQYPGLILAGSMCDGIGMADRVKQAKKIVQGL